MPMEWGPPTQGAGVPGSSAQPQATAAAWGGQSSVTGVAPYFYAVPVWADPTGNRLPLCSPPLPAGGVMAMGVQAWGGPDAKAPPTAKTNWQLASAQTKKFGGRRQQGQEEQHGRPRRGGGKSSFAVPGTVSLSNQEPTALSSRPTLLPSSAGARGVPGQIRTAWLDPLAREGSAAWPSSALSPVTAGTKAEVEKGFGAIAAGDTMKTQLQSLQHEDPAVVFITRRINKLGLSSSEQLYEYFSHFGEVKSVHVSHSRVKSACSSHWRLRAAALGFVVMASREQTAQILATGPDHSINGVQVRVQSFHRRTGDGSALEPDDEGEVDHQRGLELSPTNTSSSEPDQNAAALYQYLACGDSMWNVSEKELQDAMPDRYDD
mmetsp:Transcript_134476/g.287709  ORF Transcript_134476/g.287709 Transcript_134476/m.287709 type:complete len:377 (+) Transcript_134476:99-1229(+)